MLLFPDDSKPKITVNMTYLVGSRHEGYGETGMAHLLEHMLFKSNHQAAATSRRNSPTTARSFNGTTSYDRTNYFETVNASDENLQWALGLEADRMVNMRMEKDPRYRNDGGAQRVGDGRKQPADLLQSACWRPLITSTTTARSTIGNARRYRARADRESGRFYQKYYQPDNADADHRRPVRRNQSAGVHRGYAGRAAHARTAC